MRTIRDNIDTVRADIAAAALSVKRDPATVNLIAVSKKQPIDRIHDVLACGHRLFGENRVQEAQQRWVPLKPDYPDLKLHLIGPLQTNKAKDAISLFDVIETLDREKLAKTLTKEMEKQNRSLPCFIQVNTGGEAQKAGIAINALKDFYDFCTQECGLNITGLMCIPPVDEPSALHFALLKKYTDHLGLTHLSMGMSNDFEKAIPLGATYIRVGTGVFGVRPD